MQSDVKDRYVSLSFHFEHMHLTKMSFSAP